MKANDNVYVGFSTSTKITLQDLLTPKEREEAWSFPISKKDWARYKKFLKEQAYWDKFISERTDFNEVFKD